MLESSVTSRSWNFSNPTKVRFGAGSRKELLEICECDRILVVTSKRGRQQLDCDDTLAPLIANKGVKWIDEIKSNPTLVDLQAIVDGISDFSPDVIVAFGGGSALDAAKVISAAISTNTTTSNVASLISDPNRLLRGAVIPVHAVPTTSGTGSEVTPFATVWDDVEQKKLSLASRWLFPETATVDPELTYALPYFVTICTGLDALNQAFESVWNRNASQVSRLLAAHAIRLAIRSLNTLLDNMSSATARTDLSEASLLSGLCISQTRTAICHSISYPLTAHFRIAHGLACAFSMMAVTKLCIERSPSTLREVSELSGFRDVFTLSEAVANLLRQIGVQKLVCAAVPSSDTVLSLVSEMYTPERGDNFVLPVNAHLLQQIVKDSLTMGGTGTGYFDGGYGMGESGCGA